MTVRYGVARNVPARDEKGNDVAIALVVIEHENGHVDKKAINEELIRFAGEGIIEDEVRQIAAGHEILHQQNTALMKRILTGRA